MRQTAHRVEFTPRLLLIHADQYKGDGQQRNRQDVPPRRGFKGRINSAPAGANAQDRAGMQRLPPFDRLPHNNNVDEAERGQDCRETGARLRLLDDAAEHQISGIDEQADEIGRQARIPRPPYAPDNSRPNAAGDQRHQGERKRYLRGRRGDAVEAQIALPQIQPAEAERDGEAGHRDDRRRQMERKNAPDGILQPLVGKLEENDIQISRNDKGAAPTQDVNDLLPHMSHPTSTVSMKNTERAVKITLKPISRFNQILLSPPIGAPASSSVVNCIAPSRAGISMGYTRMGSISSRRRRLTVRALNIAPITVMAHAPSAMTTSRPGICTATLIV